MDVAWSIGGDRLVAGYVRGYVDQARKPPHSVQVLQRWITEAERDIGVAVARQHRWVSDMVLAAMLDQVRDEDDQPLFLLEGGVALELRLDGPPCEAQ